jgi:hypothetical protein
VGLFSYPVRLRQRRSERDSDRRVSIVPALRVFGALSLRFLCTFVVS